MPRGRRDGEVSSLSVYANRNGSFEKLASFPIQSSIGILYSIVTVHLGFKFNSDEYKVMGLTLMATRAGSVVFFAGITELSGEGKYAIHLDRLSKEKSATYRGVLKYLADNVLPVAVEDGALDQSQAFYGYNPPPYSGVVTYFQPETRDFRNILEYAPEWAGRAQRVETVLIPGDHLTMLDASAVEAWGAALAERLDRISPKG
jgi:hypothetical protein